MWGAKQFNIGGMNLTNVQYANIGNQVKLIDTIKYYQQSFSSLTKNVNEMQKKNIKNSCRKFIEKDEPYSRIFELLHDNEKKLGFRLFL